MPSSCPHLVLSLLLLAGSTLAQQIPLALGAEGDQQLVSLDPLTQSTPVTLSGVDLLPLELAGEPASDRLVLGLPHSRALGTSASRVELPQGGSLLRADQLGATSLILVAANGEIQVLLTLPKRGPEPALASPIAVSANGMVALVATSEAGTPTAYAIRIATGEVLPLSAGSTPLLARAESLRVGTERAWFATDSELYRAELRATNAVVQTVDLGHGPGSQLNPALATSDEALSVALVSRDSSGARHLHVVTSAAEVLRIVDDDASLPDTSGTDQAGWLALSADGSVVAWRALRPGAAPTQEIFMQRVGQGVARHVTSDSNFIDTLDGAAIIGFVDDETALVTVGEQDPVALVDGADVFHARLDLTGTLAAIDNISMTSGLASPPFDLKGEIEILDAVLSPERDQLWLTVDPDNGDAALVSVPTQSAGPPVELLGGLLEPPLLVPAGSRALVLSKLENPQPGGAGLRVHTLGQAGAQIVGALPEGLGMSRFAYDPLAQRIGLSVDTPMGVSAPGAIDMPTAQGFLYFATPLRLTESVAFGPTGDLVFGISVGPGSPFLFVSFAAPNSGTKLPIGIWDDGLPLAR